MLLLSRNKTIFQIWDDLFHFQHFRFSIFSLRYCVRRVATLASLIVSLYIVGIIQNVLVGFLNLLVLIKIHVLVLF